MNNKLITSNLFETISGYFNQSSDSVYIISPFISENLLCSLLSEIKGKKIIIITSWRKDYLLTGVSSLGLFKKCQLNNWTLYVNDNIHAKLYICDLKSAYVGSANCTEHGLLDKINSNLECTTFVNELSFTDRSQISKIILSSVLVTDDIYNTYLEWMKNKTIKSPLPIDDIYLNSKFFTSQLPATKSPEELWQMYQNPLNFNEESQRRAEHDMALFIESDGINSFEELVKTSKNNITSNTFIKSFLNNFDKEVYFGEATAWIHSNCEDDPAPYRKDVKQLVSNLFNWVCTLYDEYEITIPGKKSQCLKKS